MIDDDAVSDTDECDHDSCDEDGDLLYDAQSRSSRRSSYQYQPSYHYQARPPPFPSFPFSSSPEPSPPTSYDSDQNVLLDEDASFFADEKERRSVVKRYRAVRSKAHSENKSAPVRPSFVREADEDELVVGHVDAPLVVENDEEDDNGHGHNKEEEGEEASSEEWTPTCAQAMRRQWQAISLGFRFGVFRAKRRVRNRIFGT